MTFIQETQLIAKNNAEKGEVNWVPGSDSKLYQLVEGHYSGINFGFGNIGFAITTEGVVVFDSTVSPEGGEAVLAEIRKLTSLPIRYLIYTHGHADHVSGASVFKREGAVVIGHRNIVRRFDRYTKLWSHHMAINGLQFRKNLFTLEPNFVYPDITYDQEYTFELGGKTFRLVHGKGETDDATVTYVPEDGVVYVGDFILWTFPNIGNPNKVIRYEKEWYQTLERVQSWNPKAIATGHGPALLEPEQIEGALAHNIEVLKLLHERTIDYINKGASEEQAVAEIELPEHLLNSPFLTQVYGTREFVIRGIYRRYTGWFNGNPTHLAPAPTEDVRREITGLIGNTRYVLDRAKELKVNGQTQLSLHLIDLVIAEPELEKEAIQFKREALLELADQSRNLFYHNFYTVSAEELENN
ncbi:Metallo-beta-lactamase superfamily protein [Fontibacillus panacisegetis]|uniref:Metallo-beta-lactamase superfamily protein n=1 Tax=Fontibacillus panacisegetis TaxID=670482 RepID=A0A1G7RJN0_9BACL|nr:alkyl sulfatase dimerization domain-containing protein [Fontibacillus panacisegetis]SDG10937.1 Metallo-beta-lactamase superfamily protein [Fontibacillus panacisegetis]